MNLLSLFSPGSLVIWIPGLLLLIAMFTAYSRIKAGMSSKQVKLTGLALYIVVLILVVFVPNSEINKAISFANAYDSTNEPVSRFEDISYEAKGAYRMTAMSEEERTDFLSWSGVEDRGPIMVDGDEVVHNPDRALAWSVLFALFVISSLVFLQAPKRFISE